MPKRHPHIRLVRLPLDQTIGHAVGHTFSGVSIETTPDPAGRTRPDHDRLVMTIGQAEKLADALRNAVREARIALSA